MSLTREELLAHVDGQLVEVKLPHRDGTVFLRPMTAGEADRYARLPESQQTRAALAVRVICDENGKRLFGDKESGVLGKALSSRDMQAITECALAMNGLKEEAVEEIEAELDEDGENPTA